jgi:electron transfer flavoprotein beta subunit
MTVTERPLVVACLRITDLRTEIDPLTGAVSRDPLGVGLTAADGAALEHALRIAEAWSGRVIALAAGPASIEPVLREVLALGVEVVRIPLADEEDGPAYTRELAGDERWLASALVAALASHGPVDLVVCGDRSVDRGTGALPAYLAHELGAAQALGLVALEARSHAGERVLLADRRLDAGWRERLRVPLPAICSVEGAGVRLRRASLSGALSAEGVPVPVDPSPQVAAGFDPAVLAPVAGGVEIGATAPFRPRTRIVPGPDDDDPRIRVLALTGALAAHDPPTVVEPADATEAVDVLLAFLERHGYLAAPDGTPEGAGR